MADKYSSFAALSKEQKEGIDFEVEYRVPNSSVAFIAPHGGGIEPMTAELADALAGGEFRYYGFKGLKSSGNRDLHITSTNFDEKRCLEVIQGCKIVIALHGLNDTSTENEIDVGGRNSALREAISAALINAGFKAKVVITGSYGAISPDNICNRGSDSGGVQLELSATLRGRMRDGPRVINGFIVAVRSAIAHQSRNAQ